MNSYLDKIIEQTASAVEIDKQKIPLQELKSYLSDLNETKGFFKSIKARYDDGLVSVIAEIKRASPSQGLIRENFNPKDIAQSYQASQATCLSVLTDAPFFQGCLEDLSSVREVVDLPLLRKDFIVDEYQIYQSRFYGADCILLIASVLSDIQLKEFKEIAQELNLDVLVEVHNTPEMDRAKDLGFSLIGINNRDLKTFKVNLETTINLSEDLQDKIIVSESGIKTKEDVKKIMSSGTRTFLVGESFMRASNPGEELKKLFFSC
jgi:indole-3-glycerol phosphate synthase